VAALVVASAAVLFTAACGGGSDDPATAATGGPGGDGAFSAYVECLNKNGVTITMPSGGARSRPSGQPRPSGSAGPRGGGGLPGGGMPGGGGFGKPDGVDDATWQKAQEACASLRPSGGPGGGPGGGRNGGGRNAAYENCLKDNGVTATGGQLATADPAVRKAIEKCQVLRPRASATPSS
jgi:hypothetical protein